MYKCFCTGHVQAIVTIQYTLFCAALQINAPCNKYLHLKGHIGWHLCSCSTGSASGAQPSRLHRKHPTGLWGSDTWNRYSSA